MSSPDPPFDLAIGLDPSDRKVDLYLVNVATGAHEQDQVQTKPEALHDWAQGLRSRYPQARLAICLEQPTPPLLLPISTGAAAKSSWSAGWNSSLRPFH